MRRYIETGFRLKFRIIIAALLAFGAVAGALLFFNKGYQSSAAVWVEQPIYYTIANDWNKYKTPAENESSVMKELLQTRDFTLSVAQKADLPTGTPAHADQAIRDIQSGVRVVADGTHLVRITYTCTQPKYCKPVVASLVEVFKQQRAASQTQQATSAIALYQKQRDAYEDAVTKSRYDLENYLQANPQAVAAGSSPDPTLVELQQAYQADRTRYEEILAKIEGVQVDANNARQLNDEFVRLVDAPADPQTSTLSTKQLLLPLGLGTGVGLIVAIALILLSVWIDPAIYAVRDVAGLVPTTDETENELIVGVVPFLKPLGKQRRQAEAEAKRAAKAARKGGAAEEPISVNGLTEPATPSPQSQP